ncbi:GatB/YqeY domain-containing protein [Marinagarivorans algicola]|uniref:GatB/YqeY domain-containing protein n=1 Tax=Marinagarivorans algicola TaxID=1513270 RepID=UPI0006B5DE8D|nr:GatB/YqeY domain-containing protein [Marinagarivorans algicola]
MMSEIKQAITSAVKDAMRAKAKERLSVLRMVTAEFKRIEVDERIELDDARVLAVLDKMTKQRRDAATQFTDANRQDLADIENFEIEVIQAFLPQALTEEEIHTLIREAIASTGASNMGDMGKVMGIIKPRVQGRADMGAVSKLIKASLQD